MKYDTFRGDYHELARFIEVEWSAFYNGEPHFAYPVDWLVPFLSGEGADPDLLVEARDDAGTLAGFVAAVPRDVLIDGTRHRFALCLLLTASSHHAKFLPGFGVLRELFRRCATRGYAATYHFCVVGQKTDEVVTHAALREKRKPFDLEAVGSLMALPRGGAETPSVRAIESEADREQLGSLVERTGQLVPVRRAESIERLLANRRALAVFRGERAVGACTYLRRRMVGKVTSEILNVDLLIGPELEADEAKQLGGAIAREAYASGVQVIVAPERPAVIFPQLRAAGFRKGARNLRTLIVPFTALGVGAPPEPAGAGPSHLLEVE